MPERTITVTLQVRVNDDTVVSGWIDGQGSKTIFGHNATPGNVGEAVQRAIEDYTGFNVVSLEAFDLEERNARQGLTLVKIKPEEGDPDTCPF